MSKLTPLVELTPLEIELIGKRELTAAVKCIRLRNQCDEQVAYHAVQSFVLAQENDMAKGLTTMEGTAANFFEEQEDGTLLHVQKTFEMVETKREILGRYRLAQPGEESRADGLSYFSPEDFELHRVVPV